MESCIQSSKIKSQGIPIMSNIYILEVFYFYFFSLTFFFSFFFFFPMEFDPDYKNSLSY